jgi:deoxyribose-phosphate aldolase
MANEGRVCYTEGMEPINRYLDAAVLKPELTREEAIAAIKESIGWKTRTVCVRPCDIALAKSLCAGTETGVSCVLSFPHGTEPTPVKAFAAETYADLGADEIDMVANFGLIRSGAWAEVEADVAAVAAVCKRRGVLLKVIFETCYLTEAQIERAVEACVSAGADFVKTSTGFASGGATVEAVQTMIRAAKGRVKVKPSGGIRDRETAIKYVEMGAERLGTNYAASEAICAPGSGASPKPGAANPASTGGKSPAGQY